MADIKLTIKSAGEEFQVETYGFTSISRLKRLILEKWNKSHPSSTPMKDVVFYRRKLNEHGNTQLRTCKVKDGDIIGCFLFPL